MAGGGGGGTAGLKAGRVKAWFEDQGFGFIQQDDGSEDLFVHRRALTDGNVLELGAAVLYDTVWNEQKQKMMASQLSGASSPMSAGLATGCSSRPPNAEGKKTGRVKAWFEDQGFGFILQDDGGEDLFVHRRALTDGNLLIVGAAVAYEVVWNDRKQKTLCSNLTGASSPIEAGIATTNAPMRSSSRPGGSTAGPSMGGKKTGRVKAWFEDQGFGFVLQDNGEEDLFVHRRALTDGNLLLVGAPVAYESVFNEQKQKMLAANLTGASSPIQAGIATGGAASMLANVPVASGGGKQTGRVKAWFEDQGFGFILQDNGEEDLFVHRRALTDGNLLLVGAPVAYEAVWNDAKGKTLAANLTGASSPIQAGIATGGANDRYGGGPVAMVDSRAAPMAGGSGGQSSGRVKAWFEDNGFGFILQDDGGEDLFVHRSALSDGGSLVIGATVFYEAVWNERKQKYLAAGVSGAVPQGGKGMAKGGGAGMVATSSMIPTLSQYASLGALPVASGFGGLGAGDAASMIGAILQNSQNRMSQNRMSDPYGQNFSQGSMSRFADDQFAVAGGMGGYGRAMEAPRDNDRYDPYGEQSFWTGPPAQGEQQMNGSISPHLMAAAFNQLSGPAG